MISSRIGSILLFALLAIGAATPAVRTIKINSTLYARMSDIAARSQMALVGKNGRLELTGSKNKAVFTVNSREFYFNGVRILAGYAVRNQSGSSYISHLDWQKSLQPLLDPIGSTPRRKILTITLDAGHGGNDQGTSGRSTVEKKLTLRLARRVGEILGSCGYRIRYSRTTDKYVSLGDRALAHRKSGSDLFVSIHFNSSPATSVSGIESFALTPVGMQSSNGGDVVKSASSGNATDADNLLLAYNIQRALLNRTKAVDRGVKRARFAVLRDITTPGVLVELGFLSNRAEERRIMSADYFEKLARGIADGVIAYHRSIWRRP